MPWESAWPLIINTLNHCKKKIYRGCVVLETFSIVTVCSLVLGSLPKNDVLHAEVSNASNMHRKPRVLGNWKSRV